MSGRGLTHLFALFEFLAQLSYLFPKLANLLFDPLMLFGISAVALESHRVRRNIVELDGPREQPPKCRTASADRRGDSPASGRDKTVARGTQTAQISASGPCLTSLEGRNKHDWLIPKIDFGTLAGAVGLGELSGRGQKRHVLGQSLGLVRPHLPTVLHA